MPTRRRDIAYRLRAAKSGARALFDEFPYLTPLLQSPTAAALAAGLSPLWALRGRDTDTAPCHVDDDNATLWVNTRGMNALSIMRSRYFRKNVAANTLTALRTGWQTAPIQTLYETHAPALWPHIARLQAADAAVMTIRMAYEMLHYAADESLWRYVLGEDIGDMAKTYADTRTNAGDTTALRAAHARWYASLSRINAADATLLAHMDAHPPVACPQARTRLDAAQVQTALCEPLNNAPYIDPSILAAHDMPDAVNRAHFARILEDMSLTRIGELRLRDADLARRLMRV